MRVYVTPPSSTTESTRPSASSMARTNDDCDGSVDEGLLTTYYRDRDGDGFGDVAVGAQGDSGYTGTTYVYFGTATGLDPASEVTLSASDAEPADYFGHALAGLGDVDGDGRTNDDDHGACSDSVSFASARIAWAHSRARFSSSARR